MNKPQMEPVSWSYRVVLLGEKRLVSWNEDTGVTVGGFNSAQAMALLKMLSADMPAPPPPSERPTATPDETPPIRPASRVVRPAPLVRETPPTRPGSASPERLAGLLGNPLGSSADHPAQEKMNDSEDVEPDRAGDQNLDLDSAQSDEGSLPLVFGAVGPDLSSDPIGKAIADGDPMDVDPEAVAAIDEKIAEVEAKAGANGAKWTLPEPGSKWKDVAIRKVVDHGDGGCLLVLENGDRVRVGPEGEEMIRLEGEPLTPDEAPKNAEAEVAAIENAQENEGEGVQEVPSEILDSPKIRLLVNYFIDQGLDRNATVAKCMDLKDSARSLKRKKDPRASIETCLAGMSL